MIRRTAWAQTSGSGGATLSPATITVLMADDDPDDCLLVREAFEECKVGDALVFVEDGELVMDYLLRRGRYAGQETARPALILLDLNMPRKNGLEVLEEIRATPELSTIPVIVLTTSQAPEDVVAVYERNANSYITKPFTYEGLLGVMSSIKQYWFQTVAMPAAADIDDGG